MGAALAWAASGGRGPLPVTGGQGAAVSDRRARRRGHGRCHRRPEGRGLLPVTEGPPPGTGSPPPAARAATGGCHRRPEGRHRWPGPASAAQVPAPGPGGCCWLPGRGDASPRPGLPRSQLPTARGSCAFRRAAPRIAPGPAAAAPSVSMPSVQPQHSAPDSTGRAPQSVTTGGHGQARSVPCSRAAAAAPSPATPQPVTTGGHGQAWSVPFNRAAVAAPQARPPPQPATPNDHQRQDQPRSWPFSRAASWRTSA
ncbi:hypothetical protein SAMN05421835_101337 [Amycolatopsis sacchari]|uniref:Uncharacterized protein n=1 Tax=Amycolatopsis sacchari TaxID=115433 RepID=A0A1I3JYJ3_9PSEU|nr:hypothetical protein SAMN05421835_101337 [Amycolatopsis sacchari]